MGDANRTGVQLDADWMELRREIERRTDHLTQLGWRMLGERRTRELIELVDPVGDRFVSRIDRPAGPNWMPAARRPSG